MSEAWLPVIGYVGLYEVSDFGQLRSVDGRRLRDGRTYKGRILKQVRAGGVRGFRYLSVALSNGEAETLSVHRLVLEAFVGQCPTGMEGCHNDGNTANNRLSNLRWGTHSANLLDRRLHGTAKTNPKKGAEAHAAKLNETDVGRVKDMYRNGCTQRAIASWMGVSRGAVIGIVYGHTWKHLLT